MITAFESATVFDPARQDDYTAGGVVSRQVVKITAGNVTRFAFDREQGSSELNEVRRDYRIQRRAGQDSGHGGFKGNAVIPEQLIRGFV